MKPREVWLIQRGDGRFVSGAIYDDAVSASFAALVMTEEDENESLKLGPYSAVRCIVLEEGTEVVEGFVKEQKALRNHVVYPTRGAASERPCLLLIGPTPEPRP